MKQRIFFSLGVLILAIIVFALFSFLEDRNLAFSQRQIIPSPISAYERTSINLEKSFSLLDKKTTFNFSNANKFRKFYKNNGYIRGTINGDFVIFNDDKDIPSEFRVGAYAVSDMPVFIDYKLLATQKHDFFKGERYAVSDSAVYKIPPSELLNLFSSAKEKELSFAKANDYKWFKMQIPYVASFFLFLLWCAPFCNWLKRKLKCESFKLHISFRVKK